MCVCVCACVRACVCMCVCSAVFYTCTSVVIICMYVSYTDAILTKAIFIVFHSCFN